MQERQNYILMWSYRLLVRDERAELIRVMDVAWRTDWLLAGAEAE